MSIAVSTETPCLAAQQFPGALTLYPGAQSNAGGGGLEGSIGIGIWALALGLNPMDSPNTTWDFLESCDFLDIRLRGWLKPGAQKLDCWKKTSPEPVVLTHTPWGSWMWRKRCISVINLSVGLCKNRCYPNSWPSNEKDVVTKHGIWGFNSFTLKPRTNIILKHILSYIPNTCTHFYPLIIRVRCATFLDFGAAFSVQRSTVSDLHSAPHTEATQDLAPRWRDGRMKHPQSQWKYVRDLIMVWTESIQISRISRLSWEMGHGMPWDAMGCHGMPWDAIVVDSQWFSCHVDPLKQSPSGDRTCCYGGFHVCPIRPMVLCSVEMTDPNLGPMLTGCSLWLLLLHLNKLVRFNDSIWCS